VLWSALVLLGAIVLSRSSVRAVARQAAVAQRA
jgi:hypothetical protein